MGKMMVGITLMLALCGSALAETPTSYGWIEKGLILPTGVAVTAAQQHGGPWPSSTRPESTSVGDAALARFLRPVCLQDAPAWLVGRQGRPV